MIFCVVGLVAETGCADAGPRDPGNTGSGSDGLTGVPTAGSDSDSDSDSDTDASGGTSTTGDTDGSASDTDPSAGSNGNTTDDSTTGDPGPGTKWDLGAIPDAPSNEGECAIPQHIPCDDLDDDIWHAIGVNCPNEFQVTANYNGLPDQTHVLTGQLGTYNPPTYPPREGEKILIFSSGVATELPMAGTYMSTDLGMYTPIPLPAPIDPNPVSMTEDCAMNPALIGTGDCSNTIMVQWSQGNGSAYDLAEMRMEATVPLGAYGFSYDFAFFSTEYPVWYQTQYNDMYIAWLESEQWTGNISFDEMGNPISLNAGFLDYKDAPNNFDCPACTAPELQGTAMEGHAGTKWLTTTAGVTPGEDVIIQFVIMDLSDGILDSTVILDNFLWDCEGGPPVTVPG